MMRKAIKDTRQEGLHKDLSPRRELGSQTHLREVSHAPSYKFIYVV